MKPHFGQSDATMNKLAGCNSFPNGGKTFDLTELERMATEAGCSTPYEYLRQRDNRIQQNINQAATSFEKICLSQHDQPCDCAVCDEIAMRIERANLVENSDAATAIADLKAKYDIEAKRGDRLAELLKKQTRLNAQILTQIGAGKEDLAEYIARHDRYRSGLHIIAHMGISGLSWQYDYEKCVNIAIDTLDGTP